MYTNIPNAEETSDVNIALNNYSKKTRSQKEYSVIKIEFLDVLAIIVR